MFLRLFVGFLCLLVLGYASGSLQEYLSNSTGRGTADAVASGTLDEDPDGAPARKPRGVPEPIAAERIERAEAAAALRVAALPKAGGTYSGRVLAQDGATPLEGVRVERDGSLLARTDVNGRFTVEVPSSACTAVGLVADGYGLAYVFLDEPAADPSSDHVVVLRRAASLQGRVLDDTGAPKAGVRVVVSTRAERLETSALEDPVARRRRIHPADPRWEAVCDARGVVRMDGLPAGVPLSISLWEQDVVCPRVEAPAVEHEAFRTETGLPPGCFLASSEALVLNGGETRSTEWRLPSEAERPTPDADHHGNDERPTSELPVAFGEEDLQPDAIAGALSRARSITGSVLDDEGQALEGLILSARPTGGVGITTATSEPDGSFSIAWLDEGEHEVVVYGGERYGTQTFGPFTTGSGDLVIELDSGTVINGRCVDAATGQPLATELSLVAATALAPRIATSRSSAAGDFRIHDQRPGNYHLVATTADGRIALSPWIELAPATSARGLELSLAPGGRLSISSHSGKRVKRAVFYSDGRGFASLEIRSGIVETVLVPGGRIDVRLYDGVKELDKLSVDVEPGGKAYLRFD